MEKAVILDIDGAANLVTCSSNEDFFQKAIALQKVENKSGSLQRFNRESAGWTNINTETEDIEEGWRVRLQLADLPEEIMLNLSYRNREPLSMMETDNLFTSTPVNSAATSPADKTSFGFPLIYLVLFLGLNIDIDGCHALQSGIISK